MGILQVVLNVFFDFGLEVFPLLMGIFFGKDSLYEKQHECRYNPFQKSHSHSAQNIGLQKSVQMYNKSSRIR